MDPGRLQRIGDFEWQLPRTGAMRVPGVIYADEALVRAMDDKVPEQVANVAALPGIVKASFAMPDAHWGYGFPIGGVAAFDPDEGGVVSAGGVGFDISCGVRMLLTGSDVRAGRAGQAAARRHARRAHPGWRRQHRRAAPHGRRDGRDAARRRALGGGPRLRAARGPRAHRGARRHGRRRPRARVGRGEATAARRDGHAGLRQPLPRGAARGRGVRLGDGRGVRAPSGRHRRQHPLRVARPRTSDRHGIPARDGDHRGCGGHPAARTASSPARRYDRRWASAISARCAPRSTAHSPTGRSSRT